jgi:hypothetical protein
VTPLNVPVIDHVSFDLYRVESDGERIGPQSLAIVPLADSVTIDNLGPDETFINVAGGNGEIEIDNVLGDTGGGGEIGTTTANRFATTVDLTGLERGEYVIEEAEEEARRAAQEAYEQAQREAEEEARCRREEREFEAGARASTP